VTSSTTTTRDGAVPLQYEDRDLVDNRGFIDEVWVRSSRRPGQAGSIRTAPDLSTSGYHAAMARWSKEHLIYKLTNRCSNCGFIPFARPVRRDGSALPFFSSAYRLDAHDEMCSLRLLLARVRILFSPGAIP
jgi:hypothetical protein